jgi:hypothetical protein
MKSKQIIFFLSIVIILLSSCRTTPSYIFYHSDSGIPQVSKYIKSEFIYVNSINRDLPFEIVAAIDKNVSNEIFEYYVILSIGENNYFNPTVENYINPYHTTLKADKVFELIDNLDKSLLLFDTKQNWNKGMSIEYSISNDYSNLQTIQVNQEWLPDFKYIFKSFESGCEAYINLGIYQGSRFNTNYCYYLTKEEVIELKLRLSKALEELKKLGMR